METGRNEDARVARDRALAAIPGSDFETAQALWRAALRYGQKHREKRGGLESTALLAGHARITGGSANVDLNWEW